LSKILKEPFQKKIFNGHKHAEFASISVEFEVRQRISPKQIKIFNIGELVFDSDFSRVEQNKSGEVSSSYIGDLGVELYPPKTHFSENHISAPGGCCAPEFFSRARK